MSVRRDSRTGSHFFRTTVKRPDGTKVRISGTPGVPGDFQDLPGTKVGAQQAERRAINAVMNGKPLAVAAAPATKETPTTKTIAEHAISFSENYKPESKPSEKRTKKWTLDNHLLPFFGQMRIEDLKQTDVDSWARLELKRGMTVKTTNNRLAILSTLIKYTTGEKSKLRFKLAGMAGEMFAVEMADVEKLLAVCKDDRYRAVVLLATEAGLRAGEIRGLQWTDIKDGQLTVRRALDTVTNEVIAPKHNKPRTVPLSPRIVATLARLPRRGVWVVSCLDGSLLGYWGMLEGVQAIYDRAKVARPKKALHCLRHSFGTEMAKKVPLGVLQKLMGHSDITTTLRYVDISEDDKRDAIVAVFGSVAATWQQESKK